MQRYEFKAQLQASDAGGAFVFFPFDVEKEFRAKGRVAVRATFDGAPYSGSLMKYGGPQHMLGMPKAIRDQVGKRPGDTVEVVVWKDTAERNVAIPPPFEDLMRKEGLLSFFEQLSYTHRKEYCRWISEARREETRLKRLEKAVEMLKKGVKTPG